MNKIDIIELKNILLSMEQSLKDIRNILQTKQDKENNRLEKGL